MHQLNVLILGPNSFVSTIVELEPYLKFNLLKNDLNFKKSKIILDIVIIHKDTEIKNIKLDISNKNLIKILASNKNDNIRDYDAVLKLPTTLNEINFTIEQVVAKKTFNKNSSISIKEYLLNKNEKKLSKNKDFIILTEREIQLLELLLNQKKPVSKNNILSSVWNYSDSTDTHTIETHIYRLRKKINDKFMDQNFILNNKKGYYL
jgi:hypothetical protein